MLLLVGGSACAVSLQSSRTVSSSPVGPVQVEIWSDKAAQELAEDRKQEVASNDADGRPRPPILTGRQAWMREESVS